uniref:JmjC domain-containing protein n=1 Tax=Daucus carota subsp. sativus TaxID=79200 RepID=A0A161XR68_DAUCS
MDSNGNKRGSKRKAGRPKNKMKRIDDLGKKSEEIVRDSVQPVDQRTVLDLDAIVRDYISRTSEFCKDGQEICIVSSSDDDEENQNRANKIKGKEIIAGSSGKDDANDDRNHKSKNKDNEIVISDDNDDGGAEDDDQKIEDEHDVDTEATAPQCEEHERYFPKEAPSSPKRRKNSAMGKDDEKIQKIGSRGPNNKEKGKDGLTSRVCKSAGSKRKGAVMTDENECVYRDRDLLGDAIIHVSIQEYPKMTEDDFARLCPVCRVNCNCKSCLRLPKKDKSMADLKFTNEEKIRYSKYIIPMLLPSLKQLNEEQIREKQVEAKIQGVSISKLEVKKAKCGLDERMYCDNCRTSVADFHRSCSSCKYDLCLICCEEFRDGCLQESPEEVITQFKDPGSPYMHGFSEPKHRSCKLDETVGEGCQQKSTLGDDTSEKDHLKSKTEWKPCIDGRISCPPKTLGGCGKGILELKCIFDKDFVSNLLVAAEELSGKHKLFLETPGQQCSCFDSESEIGIDKMNLLKAASREGSSDHHLYCPTAVQLQANDLSHFQYHWLKGEPVIVKNVLELTCGLSWEPMVMWRALRQPKNLTRPQLLDVAAIDCLKWCEVYVLTHVQEVTPTSDQRANIEKLKQLQYAQDEMEFHGTVVKSEGLGSKQQDDNEEKIKESEENPRNMVSSSLENNIEGIDHPEGGALWDIFRRQDSLKLEEYLRKYYKEFRHIYCLPLDKVVHPIHDQTCYLSMEHKRRLKKEYGIEPWTFVQKLGDAVLIPAGCPYQVRNLKSCIKVSVEFVSPENVSECIRFAKEIRLLPRNHSAKDDKLEIKKMIIFAIRQAVMDLQTLHL